MTTTKPTRGRPKKYKQGTKLMTITRSVPEELIPLIDIAICELKEKLLNVEKQN